MKRENDQDVINTIMSHLSTVYSELSTPYAKFSPRIIMDVLKVEQKVRSVGFEDFVEDPEFYRINSSRINAEFASRIYEMLNYDQVIMPPSPELIVEILECLDRAADEYLLNHLPPPIDENMDSSEN